MKVILSIKPEFANKIFDGSKKYEFRKSIFKDSGIKTVIIYVSSPVKKVLGEFEIDKIISADIETLWEKTHRQSGISKRFFMSYFLDKEEGFAIKVKNARKYKKPLCIHKDFNAIPPQSFTYIE